MDTLKLRSSLITRPTPTRIINRPRPIAVKPVALNIPHSITSPDNLPEADLRAEINSLGIPVRSQGTVRGTASVFAMTFLLEFMYARHFKMKDPDLSEEFLNYASNLAIGQIADGGFFDDLDLGYQKFGNVNETLVPYRNSFDPNTNYNAGIKTIAAGLLPRLRPYFIKLWNANTGLLPSQLLAIAYHIKAGRPVAAGLRWPKDGKYKIETIQGVPMMTAPSKGDVFDGHSVVFVGYKVSDKFPGGGYLVFRNQWGTAFMDNGYGYMSFDYASKYTNDLVQYLLP